jgi:hypothetical protein
MRKFLVILRQGSAAEKLFTNNHDYTMDGHLVLTCETFDASGIHFALVKRIPVAKNQDGSDRSHESWWLSHSDISAVFQFDGSATPIGFCTTQS